MSALPSADCRYPERASTGRPCDRRADTSGHSSSGSVVTAGARDQPPGPANSERRRRAHRSKLRAMRTMISIALVLALAACHSSSLPGDGDGGGGSGGMGGGGGGGGTRVCAVLCTMGFTCCDGGCVNLRNDIHNCGAC